MTAKPVESKIILILKKKINFHFFLTRKNSNKHLIVISAISGMWLVKKGCSERSEIQQNYHSVVNCTENCYGI